MKRAHINIFRDKCVYLIKKKRVIILSAFLFLIAFLGCGPGIGFGKSLFRGEKKEMLEEKIKEKHGSFSMTYFRRKKPFKIHIDTYITSKESPNVILVPGTGSYAWLYRYFAWRLSEEGYNVFGIDFIGHGRSEGPRGVFKMKEFLEIVFMTVHYIEENYNKRIGILGTSQGGEVAFISALEDKRIKSVVSHNVFDITRSAPMRRQRLFNFPVIGPIIGFIPDFFINLKKTVNWKELYEADSLKDRESDPRVVWKYSLSSYRSIFRYKPNHRIEDMTTPVLIAVGENDSIITPKFCLEFFDYLRMEKKKFVVIPNAKHQLLVDYPEEFVPVVVEWFSQTL